MSKPLRLLLCVLIAFVSFCAFAWGLQQPDPFESSVIRGGMTLLAVTAGVMVGIAAILGFIFTLCELTLRRER